MTTTNSGTMDAPTATPPRAAGKVADSQKTGTTRPRDVTADDLKVTSSAVTEPTLSPGGDGAGSVGAATDQAVTATWISNVNVDALWMANETRNAFFHVAGGAWQKVFNGTDPAFTALVFLASQAHETGHTVSFRVEADNLVHEIYLW